MTFLGCGSSYTVDGTRFSSAECLADYLNRSPTWTRLRIKYFKTIEQDLNTLTRDMFFDAPMKFVLAYQNKYRAKSNIRAIRFDGREVSIEYMANLLGVTPQMFAYHLNDSDCGDDVTEGLINKILRIKDERGNRRPKEDMTKFDEYELHPIVLPPVMTEAEMEPYRKLALAFLLHTVTNLNPCSEKGEGRREEEMTAMASDRFLSGERDLQRLDLFCAVAQIPSTLIVDGMKEDKVGIITRIKKYMSGSRRGKTTKKSPRVWDNNAPLESTAALASDLQVSA